MTAGEMRAGTALYGRRRHQPVVLEPVPEQCPACLETGPCPVDCPERKRREG